MLNVNDLIFISKVEVGNKMTFNKIYVYDWLEIGDLAHFVFKKHLCASAMYKLSPIFLKK